MGPVAGDCKVSGCFAIDVRPHFSKMCAGGALCGGTGVRRTGGEIIGAAGIFLAAATGGESIWAGIFLATTGGCEPSGWSPLFGKTRGGTMRGAFEVEIICARP